MSANWPAIHASRSWGKYPNEHFIRFVREHYPNPGPTFFELGCGVGAQLHFLWQEGYRAFGIDISEDAISRIRTSRFGSAAALDCRVYTPPVQYDCLIDVACLQCLSFDEASHIITNALGWLKPDGRIFSLMASDQAPTGPHLANGTRASSRADIDAMFSAYDCRIGHEVVLRPNGDTVSHWIVDARKK